MASAGGSGWGGQLSRTRASAITGNWRGVIAGGGGGGGCGTLWTGGLTALLGRSTSCCCGQFWRKKEGWSMTRLPDESRAAAGGGGRYSGGGMDPGDSGRSDDATASNALSSSPSGPLHTNHRHQLHFVTSALLSITEYNPASLYTKQLSKLHELVRAKKLCQNITSCQSNSLGDSKY